MARPAKILIDLAALRHNLQQVKSLVPNASVLAMVKSNAYGHGIERIGLALTQADALGVACIEEAIALRQAGVKTPIVLLEGLFTVDELSKAAAYQFSLIVHHQSQIEMLQKARGLPPFNIWLKVNTGMYRLGFPAHQVQRAYQTLMQCPLVNQPIVLMTHFAESEATNQSHTQAQIDLFERTIRGLVGMKSLCNSAGILAWPDIHNDWVRPGIMLYGASPFPGKHGQDHGLRPVMSLTSQIIAIQQVAPGDRVGYGGTWTSSKETKIGVVGIGYGDGYPQYTKNGTPVLVNKRPCPLVGRVSMDMLTVDLSAQPEAKVGDPVVLWGPGLPVETIANNNGASPYELLTRMMQRVSVSVI